MSTSKIEIEANIIKGQCYIYQVYKEQLLVMFLCRTKKYCLKRVIICDKFYPNQMRKYPAGSKVQKTDPHMVLVHRNLDSKNRVFPKIFQACFRILHM